MSSCPPPIPFLKDKSPLAGPYLIHNPRLASLRKRLKFPSRSTWESVLTGKYDPYWANRPIFPLLEAMMPEFGRCLGWHPWCQSLVVVLGVFRGCLGLPWQYHRLGGLTNRSVLSQFRSLKVQNQDCDKVDLFWWLWGKGVFQTSLLGLLMAISFLCLFTSPFPRSVYVQVPLFIRLAVILDQEPSLLQDNLILIISALKFCMGTTDSSHWKDELSISQITSCPNKIKFENVKMQLKK